MFTEVQEQYEEINRRKKFELKDDSVPTRRVPEHLSKSLRVQVHLN